MSIDVYDACLAEGTQPTMMSPDGVALTGQLRQGVHRMLEAELPENTRKAINPKMREFLQFCKTVYAGIGNNTILTDDNVYRFMSYVAFREKRKRGGKKKEGNNDKIFDFEEYKQVMSSISSVNASGLVANCPQPDQPVGKASFDLYKATIKRIYHIQKSKGHLVANWDDLWTDHCKNLKKIVYERAPKLKKANYEEKVDATFQPYIMVERFPDIEESLWDASNVSSAHRSVASGLRNRYVFLHLTSGILRCESLHRAELSD